MHQKLGLEKDLIIGTVRAFIQLMAVGYILNFVFNAKTGIYTILMIAVMVIVAGGNAAKRGRGIPHIFAIVTFSIAVGTVVTLSILVGLKLISLKPWELIPISGMIVGNSMIAASLVITQLKKTIQEKYFEIETRLALGATGRQAVAGILRDAVKSGMIPTIDGMKTIGLVQLPGMMTGMILAGAGPIQAVRYQLLVVFMLSATVAISCIIVGLLVYRQFFTRYHQIIAIGGE